MTSGIYHKYWSDKDFWQEFFSVQKKNTDTHKWLQNGRKTHLIFDLIGRKLLHSTHLMHIWNVFWWLFLVLRCSNKGRNKRTKCKRERERGKMAGIQQKKKNIKIGNRYVYGKKNIERCRYSIVCKTKKKSKINTLVKLRYQVRCWRNIFISVSACLSVGGFSAVNQSRNGTFRCGKHW